MKVCVLSILAVFCLAAADQQQLAVMLKAQSDFERVELNPRPGISDTEACLQSQAAALSVSPPEERSLLYYRKGYCAFASAISSHNSQQFQGAVSELDKAIEAWPLRVRKPVKSSPVEPVSPPLRVFDAIARLEASTEPETVERARQEIADALQTPVCKSNVMPPEFCTWLLDAGSQWLGWFALRQKQWDEAVRRFSATPETGWNAWAEGEREFAAGHYAAAAAEEAKAIEQWKPIWQGAGPTFLRSLGPRPQLATGMADWGGARLLAGDLPGAISTLDASLQMDPANAHALFLRGRAKELAGRQDAALADYSLASRTAFAAAKDLASGEAHLYRGIVLYRRQDFAHAEEEFASSLNFEMTDALRPDARAWRHMAAVAGGACGAARESLTAELGSVSPYFPREEARKVSAICATVSAR